MHQNWSAVWCREFLKVIIFFKGEKREESNSDGGRVLIGSVYAVLPQHNVIYGYGMKPEDHS